MSNQPTELTWEKLVQIEPELSRLMADIKAVKDDKSTPSFCANTTWYQGYKKRLCELVGWTARSGNPLIRTSKAYDLAYQKLYNLLPDCRNCLCL